MRRIIVVVALLLIAAACGRSVEEPATTTVPPPPIVTSPFVEGTVILAGAGGSVSSPDGQVTVTIPRGALAEDTAIAIFPVNRTQWPPDLDDDTVLGGVFDLRPSGLTFQEPVVVTRVVDFDGGEFPVAVQSVGNEDGSWDLLDDPTITIDGGTLTLSGTTTHFSPTVATRVTSDGRPVGLLPSPAPGQADVGHGDLFLAGIQVRPAREFVPFVAGGADAGLAFQAGPGLEEIDIGLPTMTGFRCTEAGQQQLVTGEGSTLLLAVDLGGGGADHTLQPPDTPGTVSVAVRMPRPPADVINCVAAPPPDGTRLDLVTNFEQTNQDVCGSAFADVAVVTYNAGDDDDGAIHFEGEVGFTPGRPFTIGADGVIRVDDWPNTIGTATLWTEDWTIDPAGGTGTYSQDFTSVICEFPMTFDPVATSGLRIGEFDASDRAGLCNPGDTTLCLNNSRFRVELSWSDGSNAEPGRAVVVVRDSGYFWISGEQSVGMLVSVVNGCAVNERYWVQYGATRPAQFQLTVTDTVEGAVREYVNPPGQPATSFADTDAFAACP